VQTNASEWQMCASRGVNEQDGCEQAWMGPKKHRQVGTSVNKRGRALVSKMGVNEHGRVQVKVCERTDRRELQKQVHVSFSSLVDE